MPTHIQIRATPSAHEVHKELVRLVRKRGWVFQDYHYQMELRELTRLQRQDNGRREAGQDKEA